MAVSEYGYLDLTELQTDVHPVDIAMLYMGDFTVVRPDDPSSPRLLGSDGYIDCVGCLAWIEGKDGAVEVYGFTHIESEESDIENSLPRMAEMMRNGDDSKQIFFDVFGGTEEVRGAKERRPNKVFRQEVLTVIQSIPNSQIKHDLMLRNDFKDLIVVDVANGKKYAGDHFPNNYNICDISSFLHSSLWHPTTEEIRAEAGKNEEGRFHLVEYKYETLRPKLIKAWKNFKREDFDRFLEGSGCIEGEHGPSFEELIAIPMKNSARDKIIQEREKGQGDKGISK